MRIPLGNFGNAVAEPQRQARIPAAAGGQVADAVERVGRIGMGVAADMMQQQRAEENELERVRAANTLLDREMQVRTIGTDISQQLADGTLRSDQAAAMYQEQVGKLEAPKTDGFKNPATAENLSLGIKRADIGGMFAVEGVANKARRGEIRTEADGVLDRLGKLAGLPGADVDKVNAQVDAFDNAGQVAYGATWGKVKQNLKDQNWFNQARQRAQAASGDVAALDDLQRELTAESGFYVGKLDTDKRGIVLQSVTTARVRAQTRIDQAAVKQEKLAERALNDIEKQNASGVPATADQWVAWNNKVKGTTFEPEFHNQLQQAQKVQEVLRLPIDQQVSYLRTAQASLLTNGGDAAARANLGRLSTAVQGNIKMMQETPLIWAQARTGAPIQPLSLGAVATGNAAAIGEQIRDRVATIRAVQSTDPTGTVKMAPLLPEEAQAFNAALSAGGAKEKTQVLATMYRAFGDQTAFEGAVQQLKDVSPFMMRMGMRASSYAQAQLTNNFYDPDTVQAAGDVAAIALHGDEVIRAGGKAGALNYPMPKDTDFVAEIQGKVGNLYRGADAGDSAASQFMQDAYAVKAYYVGRAAQEGDVSGMVDSKRLDQAIAAVLGKPVDLHGNGVVLAPWGLDEATFSERANKAVVGELKARGLQERMGRYLNNTGLIGAGGGAYVVTLAGVPVADDKGSPIVIRLTPDADQGRDQYGRRLVDQIPGPASGPEGLLQPGNIDLSKRPTVKNADGTISTARPVSIAVEGKEVLIPAISDEGKKLSDAQAIAQYRKTGRHLGIFNTPDNAAAYAQRLHEDETAQLGGPKP